MQSQPIFLVRCRNIVESSGNNWRLTPSSSACSLRWVSRKGARMRNWTIKRLDEICCLRKEQVAADLVREDRYVALEHVDSARSSLVRWDTAPDVRSRSEEHTSELQSLRHLV